MNGALAIAIAAVSAAGVGITWVIVDAFVRIRLHRGTSADAEVNARLSRIESAVDAIAIEVERVGEIQRFNTRLAQGAIPIAPATSAEPVRIARPITPH